VPGVKITTLVDDCCFTGGLLGEHGLSILVENKYGAVLFDTGQGMALEHNIKAMGLDLSDLNAAAVSHGHNDHTGGLMKVLEMRGKDGLPIYAHRGIFNPRQKLGKDGRPADTGIPFTQVELEKEGAVFKFNYGPTEIITGIMLTGPIERLFKETSTKFHFIVKNGEFVEDPFEDDQALVVETSKGIVIIFGCAHAGVINTMNHVAKITGEKRFYALVGGTHLLKADRKQLENTLREIEKRDVNIIAFSHCTGFHSCAFFAEYFRGKYYQNDVGFSIEF